MVYERSYSNLTHFKKLPICPISFASCYANPSSNMPTRPSSTFLSVWWAQWWLAENMMSSGRWRVALKSDTLYVSLSHRRNGFGEFAYTRLSRDRCVMCGQEKVSKNWLIEEILFFFWIMIMKIEAWYEKLENLKKNFVHFFFKKLIWSKLGIFTKFKIFKKP